MLRHIWDQIRPLTRQQRFFFALALLFTLSTAVHGMVAITSLIEGQSWAGPVSWRKPVVFNASFALLMAAMVWVLRRLPQRRGAWVPTITLGAFSVIEVFVITMQQWRGQPSHFNENSLFDDAMFGIMGSSVALIILSVLAFSVWACLQFRGNAAERIAVITGLAGVLVAGYIGGSMVTEGEAVLAATGEVPYEVVFGAAGSGKLAHFIGLHGLQFLALLAIVAPAPRRTLLVVIGALGYVAVFTSVTLTAYAELPWLSPPLPLALLGLAGVAAAGFAVVRAIWLYQASTTVCAVAPAVPAPVG